MTIRLAGVMPTVWRTILVRPETKLAMLHRYLQAAMGWSDYHLFMFTIDGRRYAIPDPEWQSEIKIYDARRYTLARLFPQLPVSFDYLYDFGDHWEHRIEIERAQETEYRKQYPICIDGAEPCPPEDCGGPPGYRKLRNVLLDPHHPQFARFDRRLATYHMRDVQRGYR